MSAWCRLAILTDEVSQDLETVLRFVRESGLDGFELRSLFGKAFKDFSRAEIRTIAGRCRETGIPVAGCATPVFKCPLGSEGDLAAHVEMFQRSVEAALTVGAPMVRVFTFLRKTHPAHPDDLARAAAHFPALLDRVRGTGLRIGVENEASCLTATGPEMQTFLDCLPRDPQLGVVWDPCNALFVDGNRDPVHDDFPAIAERTIHVHVKDARRLNGRAATECVELGEGDIDLAGQFSLLKARGFRDWITLETHWRDAPLDEASLHLPAGDAFSRNAEPASRICAAHLRRFIDAA